MCGYAAAYVHSFCMLYCVERHVDMLMRLTGGSKHVGVILSVLICDNLINVLLHKSALVGPLHVVN
jgi:hypothetical protein